MEPISGKRIALLVEDIYNEFEYWYPFYRMKEAGAAVVTVGGKAGETYTSKHDLPATADKGFADVSAAEFDAVIIPGGYAPDRMRRHPACLDFVKAMAEAGKPVAFICHAGWVPISAGILQGKKATSYSSIKDDMVNAGADWRDEEVVVDGNLISSRTPDDLPAFCKAVIAALS